MTANIVKFYPADSAKDPDAVLEQAVGAFKSVLIIGWDKNGDLQARATLDLADGGEVLWLLEGFKHNLMCGVYAEADE